MNFFSIDETGSNNLARSISELRRGIPVIIAQKYLIIPAETLSKYNFNKLKQSFKDKLALVTPELKNYLVQSAAQLCFNKLKSFCAVHNISRCCTSSESKSKFTITMPSQHHRLIKEVFAAAKLMPVFLFIELDNINNKFLDIDNFIKIDVQDLAAYKSNTHATVEEIVSSVPVQLKNIGKVNITMFRVNSTGEEHLAILSGDITRSHTPLVRLHSSCYTGDLLQSLQCDCSAQLLSAIRFMNAKPENAGVILYLAQEGRGIGLANKLRSYILQAKGYDTVEANMRLGFEMDVRDYSIAASMLKLLNIQAITLLTNNPKKKEALIEHGITITKVLPLMTKINHYNKKYMETKKQKMAHTIVA